MRTASIARACMLLLLIGAQPARADQTYNESVQGDLSNDRLAPTPWTLAIGNNRVIGTFGQSPVPELPDLDYLTFTIPSTTRLTRIMLEAANVGGAVSFIAIHPGSQVSIPYNAASAAPLLGWAHFGSGNIGTDLLLPISAGSGAIGFLPPLGSGQYTLWLQELDTGAVHSYALNMIVEALPLCPANFNGANGITVQDIFDFLAAWFAADPRTDFNSQNGVTVQDIFDFLGAWFAGCP